MSLEGVYIEDECKMITWNILESLLMKSAGMPTSRNHSTMFSSFSESADVPRIKRRVR